MLRWIPVLSTWSACTSEALAPHDETIRRGSGGLDFFEPEARGADVGKVLFGPVTHGGERFSDGESEFGQGVFNPRWAHLPLRHPANVAKAAASADVLAECLLPDFTH
ncbi:MAG: hypothetical protein ACR2QO_07340 [Acidimicrobiales bacterium]